MGAKDRAERRSLTKAANENDTFGTPLLERFERIILIGSLRVETIRRKRPDRTVQKRIDFFKLSGSGYAARTMERDDLWGQGGRDGRFIETFRLKRLDRIA